MDAIRYFSIVFLQMLSIILIIGAGYTTTKKGMLDEHICNRLSALIVQVFNPLLVLSSANEAIGKTGISQLLATAAVALAMFIGFIVIGDFLVPLFSREKSEQRMYQLMFVFSNLGFIGIPVVSTVLGAEYVVHVTIFILVYNLVFYSYGIILLDGKVTKKSVASMMTFGNGLIVLALILLLAGVRLPGFLMTAVTSIGNMVSPLALITVGYTLAQFNLKEIFLNKKMYGFAVIKLVVIPLLAILVFRIVPVDRTLLPLYITMFAMPVGNFPLMIAQQRGMDTKLCSEGIIMTTVFCAVVIPMLLLLVQTTA